MKLLDSFSKRKRREKSELGVAIAGQLCHRVPSSAGAGDEGLDVQSDIPKRFLWVAD